MANVEELAGLGFEIEHGKALIGSKDTAVAAGSTAANATLLSVAGLITVSGADGTKGVIIHSKLPIDSQQRIINAAGSDLNIYPPTGASINGLAANTAFVCGANQAAKITVLSDTTLAAVGG